MADHLLLALIFLSCVWRSFAGACNFENCLQCSSDNSTCTTCKADYLFSKELKECAYSKTCPTGQFLNYTSLLCERCEVSCKNCNGPKEYQCLSCEEGYFPFYYQGLFKCMTCEAQFCAKCNELGMCNRCKEGYFLTKEDKCIPCKVKNCHNCTTSIDSCDSCELGFSFVPSDSVCVLAGKCPMGQYQDKDMNCLRCHSSCSLCNGPTENDCLECSSGFYFNFTKCTACGSKCRTCKLDREFCESCNSGQLLRGHDCVAQCDTDEYYDEVEGKCKNCARVCGRCEKEKNRCLECRDGYHFYYDPKNYSCNLRCPQGSFVQLNSLQIADYQKQLEFLLLENNNETSISSSLTDVVCQRCAPQCKECRFAPGYCVTCPAELYKYLTSCVKFCPEGTFVFLNDLTGDKFCIKCPTGCTSCYNATHCTGCTAGLKLYKNRCYYLGFKTGFCTEDEVRVGSFCMDYCPQGTMQVDKFCYCKPKCMSCAYDVNNVYLEEVLCTECKNETFWSFNGDCVEDCPSDMISVFNSYKTEVVNQTTGGKEIVTKERRICLMGCPSSQLEIWINGSRKCVSNCPPGTIKIENRCLNQLCPLGQFLDMELFKKLNSSSKTLRMLSSDEHRQSERRFTARPGQMPGERTLQASDSKNLSTASGNLTDGKTNVTSNDTANFSSIYLKACVSCENECAACIGPGMKNCTGCRAGMVLSLDSFSNTNVSQVRIANSLYAINNDKYNEFSTIMALLKYAEYLKLSVACKKECEPGWYSPSNKYCILCVQNCSVCAPGLYKFKSLCLPSCPLDTVSNNSTYTCEVINEGFKLIMKVPTYYEFISYNRDTQGTLYLFNIINPNSILPVSSINCSLTLRGANGSRVEGASNLFVQIRNEKFQSYNFIIRREMVAPGSAYLLSCNVTEAEKGRVVPGNIMLRTRPSPKGNFSVEPKAGVALKTNFTLTFTHENNNESRPLPYFYQLIRIIDGNMSVIGKGLDVVNNSKPAIDFPGMGLIYSAESLLRRSNISLVLRFPYVKEAKNVTMLLRVFNTFVEKTFVQEINLHPSNSQNYTNSSDPLPLVTRSYVEEKKQAWNLNATKISEENIVKNVFKDFNFSCDAKEDCNGNGRCKPFIQSQTQKCICSEGFSGHDCLWNTQALLESRAFVRKVLGEIGDIVDADDRLDVIDSLMDLRDSFSKNELESVLFFLQNLTTTIDMEESKKMLISSLNKIVNIFEIISPMLPPEEQGSLLGFFDRVLNSALDTLTNEALPVSNLTIDLNYTNIMGQVRSLSLIGQSDLPVERLDMKFSNLEVSFLLNEPLSELIKNESQSLYSVLLIRPASVFPQSMWNEAKRFFSSVVSFSIRYIGDKNQTLLFKPDCMMTIKIPKALKLSSAPNKPADEEIFRCVFFDYAQNQWSTEGVSYLGETEDSILCETSHLSDFSVQLTQNDEVLDKYMPQLRTIYYRNRADNVGRNIFIIFLIFGLMNMILVLAHMAGQHSKRKLVFDNLSVKGASEQKESAKPGDKTSIIVDLDESKQTFAKVNNYFDSPQKSGQIVMSPGKTQSPESGTTNEPRTATTDATDRLREKFSLYPLLAYFISLKFKDVPSEPRIYLLMCNWNFHLMQIAILLIVDSNPRMHIAALFLTTSAVFSYFLNFLLRATQIFSAENLSRRLLVFFRWLLTLLFYAAIIFGALSERNADAIFFFCSMSFLMLGIDIFVLDVVTALFANYLSFVRRIVIKRGHAF